MIMPLMIHSEPLPPWWVLLLIALLLFTQATWMFIDARKRGRRAWIWGLWGVLNCPSPLIVYLLAVVWADYLKEKDNGGNQDGH
ncbi:Negative regulatory protein YxlD [compost metagenome]